MIAVPRQETFLKIWSLDLSSRDCAAAPSADYLAFLDRPERERHDRLVSAPLRKRFLFGRVLLRTLLAELLGTTPGKIELTSGSSGRPELARGDSSIVFNLAHSGDMIVCAAASGTPCLGIDLEDTAKKHDIDAISAEYFSREENSQLQRLSAAEKTERFYILWTLKEAYLKSKGESIFSLDHGLSFNIRNSGQIEYTRDTAYGFLAFRLKEKYISSVAWQGPSDLVSKNDLIVEEVIPMVSRRGIKGLQVLGASSGSLKQVMSGESR
jgi:phosphopantetheinyl transferase